jgi:hypothetical protein
MITKPELPPTRQGLSLLRLCHQAKEPASGCTAAEAGLPLSKLLSLFREFAREELIDQSVDIISTFSKKTCLQLYRNSCDAKLGVDYKLNM